jgi:hypothetical protein
MAPAAPPMIIEISRFHALQSAHNPLTERDMTAIRPAGTIFKRAVMDEA